MRLSQFILGNVGPIMQAWEEFARSLASGGLMSTAALRNDAERMLRFIASDIDSPQSGEQQTEKSKGHGDLASGESAAHDHGIQRFHDRFSLVEMVSEYRALRASVTKLWLANESPNQQSSELVRFNESIDQILFESLARFTANLDRDRHSVLGILSHDLRGPLGMVANSAETLLLAEGLGDDQRAVVHRIKRGVQRMDVMVANLLEMARHQLGGSMPIHAEPCELRSIATDIAEEIRTTHPGAEVHVLGSACPGEWDTARMAQMFANLLSNAVQHGSEGAVRLTLRPEDRWVDITVENQGSPIPPEEQEAIFEPLRRGTGAEQATASVGLGLFVVRQIANGHGGHVRLDRSDAAGTAFTVRLPRDSKSVREAAAV